MFGAVTITDSTVTATGDRTGISAILDVITVSGDSIVTAQGGRDVAIYAPDGIKLLSSSAVIGNISTKHLEIEEHVIFHGHCIALKDETEFTQVFEQFSNEESIRNRATKPTHKMENKTL